MGLCAGIDLHSTSYHVGIINVNDKCVFPRKSADDRTVVPEAFGPFKSDLTRDVVESISGLF